MLALSTGCSLQTTATAPTPAVKLAGVKGGVHGGQSPIFNSAIGLWAAGVTAPAGTNSPATVYGTGAVNLLATANITTDANGAFSIPPNTYNCPSPNSQMYLTASGGDPTGNASASTNNTAVVEVAALGSCMNVLPTTPVQVNELTTAAAAFALGQFVGGFGSAMTGTSSTTGDLIGTSTTNTAGLINAFATAHNLVNVNTGAAAPATTPAAGTNYYFATNDALKINTIANILAACVNNASAGAPNCTALFGAVTPLKAPRSTSAAMTPTDTFQAAVYLSLNPTSTNANGSSTNLNTLFNLQSAFQVYSPALSVAPTDWTLAMNYTDTAANGFASLSSAAADANGDMWFANANTYNATTSTFSGALQINGGTGTVGGTAGTTGATIGFYTGDGTHFANGTRSVAIDQNGYAWAPGYTNAYMFKVQGGSGVVAYYPYPAGTANAYTPAIDPSGNVYVSMGNNYVGSIASTAATGTTMGSAKLATANSTLIGLAINSASVGYAATSGNALVQTFNSTTLPGTAGTPVTATGYANYGNAVDGNNSVWLVNAVAPGAIASLTSGGTFTSYSNACLSKPQFIAIDGSNNVWVSNATSSSVSVNGAPAAAIYTVCEFNNAGQLISNSTGYGPHNISVGRGIAVDLSGNVWVTSNGTTLNYVTQIIGAATPVVNPISVAIKNGKMGTLP